MNGFQGQGNSIIAFIAFEGKNINPRSRIRPRICLFINKHNRIALRRGYKNKPLKNRGFLMFLKLSLWRTEERGELP